MSDLKTSNVNIGLTKEELKLAKANPEVFVEYLKYKRDILKSIDAERLVHEKEIELQRMEVEKSKIEIEKSKIEHEKTYNMFVSRTKCIMSLIGNDTCLQNDLSNSKDQLLLSGKQIIEKENEIISYTFNYDDYIYKCYSYASYGILWEAPAYYMAKCTYNKKNGEKGQIKAVNAIVVFKNDYVNEALDKEYIFKVLDEKFKTHQFKSETDFFYGRMLKDGTIEWGIKVDGKHPPF